jgi:hypothetical protein
LDLGAKCINIKVKDVFSEFIGNINSVRIVENSLFITFILNKKIVMFLCLIYYEYGERYKIYALRYWECEVRNGIKC